jgi:hypothetical protein
LVLTDRRSGNNGKSTLGALLNAFFGPYAENNTKFVCKGSMESSRDAHSAGTEHLRNKRLIIAEELKAYMVLDEAMLKRVTGGSSVLMAGRRFGSGECFKYIWQAGLVLIFNEGDCPKFDAGDAAFMSRMLVVPMRSKFVPTLMPHDDANTYLMDVSVTERFGSWMSAALADILVEHAQQSGAAEAAVLSGLAGREDMQDWRTSKSRAKQTRMRNGLRIILRGRKRTLCSWQGWRWRQGRRGGFLHVLQRLTLVGWGRKKLWSLTEA